MGYWGVLFCLCGGLVSSAALGMGRRADGEMGGTAERLLSGFEAGDIGWPGVG